MKIAVYTCITGDYDTLKPFDESYCKEADFYFYTNNPQWVERGKYYTVLISVRNGYERYIARHIKMMPHIILPKYDYTIWVDGTTSLMESPRRLVERYLSDRDIASFRYPDEDCIYIHADKCVKAGRFSIENVAPQMEFYKSEGFPSNAGLCELRVLLRKNTTRINTLNNLCKETYRRWLTCDQLTLNYCLWKLQIKYNTIAWGSTEFKTGLHMQYNPHKYILQ